MDEKFHRESARIYTFVASTRPAPGERIEPRLYSADIVPLRGGVPQAPAPADRTGAYADLGSGWYHDAAIRSTEPFKH